MKKQKFVLHNDKVRSNLIARLEMMSLEPVMEITIQAHKRSRSLEQNAHYWAILTVIGNDLGMTKDEMHEVYKEKFLLPIFCRDDVGYADMCSAVQAIPPGGARDRAWKMVIGMTSTTQCNVGQMREYLNDCQNHAVSLGIRLPAPDYKEAL